MAVVGVCEPLGPNNPPPPGDGPAISSMEELDRVARSSTPNADEMPESFWPSLMLAAPMLASRVRLEEVDECGEVSARDGLVTPISAEP